jgi:gamma-glutamyltranspeptidase / glutathione hydrolase
VVYPEAGNIGGGGFMVTRMADGSTAALDFREKAPLAAHRDMFLDAAGQLSERSVVGHLASGVPGAVMGLWEAHRRFGSLPWRDLVQPAITLAADGFIVDRELAGSIRGAAALLRRFDASAALFLPGGQPLAQGSRWGNPDLAQVLRRIAERGPEGFYAGETADLIVAEMQRGGGIITHEDLRRYRAEWRTPVEFTYRGHRVISMPPASSGGITLAIIGNILDGYPLGQLGWHSDTTLHLTAEAMR